jgi:hypothetical protein
MTLLKQPVILRKSPAGNDSLLTVDEAKRNLRKRNHLAPASPYGTALYQASGQDDARQDSRSFFCLLSRLVIHNHFSIFNSRKTEPGVSSAVTPDGSVANKFSSPPTGTEKRLPVGYKNKPVSVFGITPSADTFNPVAAFQVP